MAREQAVRVAVGVSLTESSRRAAAKALEYRDSLLRYEAEARSKGFLDTADSFAAGARAASEQADRFNLMAESGLKLGPRPAPPEVPPDADEPRR